MSRPDFAANILRPLQPTSILDLGCRDSSLADLLPAAEYAGADLVQNAKGRVKYVGDVTSIELTRRFDAVVALDILEHLVDPSDFFDRIVASAADRLILISLPNTYDLKSRMKFLFSGHLGGKYEFLETTPRDRHHWLMNRREIADFYRKKAAKHGLSLQQFDMSYGDSGLRTARSSTGRVLSRLLPPSLTAPTIFGLFTKPNAAAHPH